MYNTYTERKRPSAVQVRGGRLRPRAGKRYITIIRQRRTDRLLRGRRFYDLSARFIWVGCGYLFRVSDLCECVCVYVCVTLHNDIIYNTQRVTERLDEKKNERCYLNVIRQKLLKLYD